MTIIEIEKYNRTIKKTKMSRLTSGYELNLMYNYNIIQGDDSEETLRKVAESLKGNRLLSEEHDINFYYRNKEGNNDIKISFRLESKSKCLNSSSTDEQKVTYTKERQLDCLKPVKQYVCSTLYKPTNLMSAQYKEASDRLSQVVEVDVFNIPDEVLQEVQKFIHPASLGIDLKPIFTDIRDIRELKWRVAVVRHLLLALSMEYDVLIFDNINININEENEEEIVDLLSKCSPYIDVFYTRQKRIS